MSKSLARVTAALTEVGLATDILEMPGGTRTAEDAARAAGCEIDQIVKSIVFRGAQTGHVVLFLTADGNRVDPGKAGAVAGQALERADAEFVRSETGFAIGGVAPLGHLRRPETFWDRRLSDFAEIWAAAGTPRHVFCIEPSVLLTVSGAQPADFTS